MNSALTRSLLKACTVLALIGVAPGMGTEKSLIPWVPVQVPVPIAAQFGGVIVGKGARPFSATTPFSKSFLKVGRYPSAICFSIRWVKAQSRPMTATLFGFFRPVEKYHHGGDNN